MITKLDKKDNWVQVNFRVPRGYKTALRTLAAASGLDIENLGADALGLFMGQKPLDEQEYKLAKKKMKEANIEKLCKEPPRPFDLTPTDKVKASPLTRYGPCAGDRELNFGCAVSSVVEHVLDTDGVRGSIPLPRTINFRVIAIKKPGGQNPADATTLGSLHTPSALLDSKSSVSSSPVTGATPVVPDARRSLHRYNHKAGSG